MKLKMIICFKVIKLLYFTKIRRKTFNYFSYEMTSGHEMTLPFCDYNSVRYCVAMNRQECLFYRRSDIPV